MGGWDFFEDFQSGDDFGVGQSKGVIGERMLRGMVVVEEVGGVVNIGGSTINMGCG